MPRHDIYLLHVWRGEVNSDRRWAGRIEHVPLGHTYRFASMEDLLATLRCLLTTEGLDGLSVPESAAAEEPEAGAGEEV